MLQGIRAASEHWLGKIVLAIIFSLLMFGIGIYGVEDLVRGGGSNAVATVGDTKISPEKGPPILPEPARTLSGAQLKRALSPEQARSLGLDRQVMSQLITEAALDQKTRDSRARRAGQHRAPGDPRGEVVSERAGPIRAAAFLPNPAARRV